MITKDGMPRAAVSALCAIALVLVAPGAAHADVFFDRSFGIGVDTGNHVFENCTIASGCQDGVTLGDAGGTRSPRGTAVDAKGGILVADYSNNRVDRFVIGPDGTATFDRAFGVDVDPSHGSPGDFENCTVTCQSGTASANAGGLEHPEDVAVDGQGRILVGDASSGRISRFAVAPDGTVSFDRAFGIDVNPSAGNPGDFENCTTICQAGTQNGSAGGLTDSAGLEVDAQGRILVADFLNKRIDRFTVGNDGSVAFDLAFGGNVDPSDGDTGLESCTAVCQTGTATDVAGGLGNPDGIAVDSQGRILVADSSYRRVSRFAVAGDGSVSFDRAFGVGVDPSGSATAFENCTTSCQQGLPSGAAGGLSAPGGIAVDSQGRILVADSNVDRVDRFFVAADGTVSFDRAFGINVDPSNSNTGFESCTTTCQSGSPSPAAGGVAPFGIAVDAAGRIVAGDFNHNRISIFRPPQVTVRAALAPAGDGGRFDLQVNGAVVNSGVGDGGIGRMPLESPDTVTVSEQAAAGTSLSDYDTTIECGDGPHAGTSLTIPALTADVTCTITDTRKPTPAGPGGDSGGGGGTGGGSSGTPGGGSSPGGTQPGGPLADTTRPALGSLGLTNKVFAVDKHGVAETAVAASAKRGTVFRYTLSEKARVVVQIERATAGRKVGSSCVKQTHANRKRRACTRYVSAGSFAVASAAGKDQHAFSGKIGHKSLAPATYRASVVAIDAAGNRSAVKRLSFRVVKR